MTVHYGGFFEAVGTQFHLECNLPHITPCPTCKALLKSKAKSLGTTANEAVKDLKKKSGQAPPDDDYDETSDGESSEGEDDLLEPVNGERPVGDLLATIL